MVIQTDWLPESEYGATYNLVGDGYRVDKAKTTVRGPMVVEGRATGVDVEVRSGGPAIEFAPISDVMYADRDITLGSSTPSRRPSCTPRPTISVAAPMDISPGAIMWSPEEHPDWNTMVDIGQADDAKVLVTKDDLFPQYLVGTGILRANQLDDSYDGSPTKFVDSGGTIAQGGFSTNEPYVYQNELPDWGRPIAFQLVHDTGFEAYTQTLSIRAGDKDRLAPCLRKLVPLIQRSTVEFITKRTNDLIEAGRGLRHRLLAVQRGAGQVLGRPAAALGIVGNGPDQTIGNFDLERVAGVLEIVRTIFAGRRTPQGGACPPRTWPPTSSSTRRSACLGRGGQLAAATPWSGLRAWPEATWPPPWASSSGNTTRRASASTCSTTAVAPMFWWVASKRTPFQGMIVSRPGMSRLSRAPAPAQARSSRRRSSP